MRKDEKEGGKRGERGGKDDDNTNSADIIVREPRPSKNLRIRQKGIRKTEANRKGSTHRPS